MIRYLMLILLASQLAACASMGPSKKAQGLLPVPHNTEKILAIDHWRLLGRLSVRNSHESWLTKLEWKHDVVADNLTLSTSLGGVVARLIYSRRGIAMSDKNGDLKHISEEELQALLGYSPPLEHLRYWVRGLPSPEMQVLINVEQPTGIKIFKQAGWDVKLERFNKFGDIALPSKISLTKNTLKIKLVVDEWLI